jgi:predicted transcriptional regulator
LFFIFCANTHAFRIPAAQEELTLQHRQELQDQRTETAKLKDQLIQTGSEHARAVKEAISAGQAQVEETQQQFAKAEEQLQQELKVAQDELQAEKKHLQVVQEYLKGIEDMVKDTNARALRKLFSPFL